MRCDKTHSSTPRRPSLTSHGLSHRPPPISCARYSHRGLHAARSATCMRKKRKEKETFQPPPQYPYGTVFRSTRLKLCSPGQQDTAARFAAINRVGDMHTHTHTHTHARARIETSGPRMEQS